MRKFTLCCSLLSIVISAVSIGLTIRTRQIRLDTAQKLEQLTQVYESISAAANSATKDAPCE